MDESAIYLDSPSYSTYTEKGQRRVKATTSGSDRVRISSAFTAASNGSKLPIFSLIPRAKPIPELDLIGNIAFQYRSPSTFNNEVILEYLQRVVVTYMTAKSYDRVLLILDQATCHMADSIKLFCQKNNIFLHYIPGRMTNLLQPADLMWFAPIKKVKIIFFPKIFFDQIFLHQIFFYLRPIEKNGIVGSLMTIKNLLKMTMLNLQATFYAVNGWQKSGEILILKSLKRASLLVGFIWTTLGTIILTVSELTIYIQY